MIFLVGTGGALGALARFMLGNIQNRYGFPIWTWVINITGSFLLGFLAQLHLSDQISEWLWLFGGAGFCGAYTTFSTFSFETIHLFRQSKVKSAVSYVLTSVAAGIVAVVVGFSAGHVF